MTNLLSFKKIRPNWRKLMRIREMNHSLRSKSSIPSGRSKMRWSKSSNWSSRDLKNNSFRRERWSNNWKKKRLKLRPNSCCRRDKKKKLNRLKERSWLEKSKNKSTERKWFKKNKSKEKRWCKRSRWALSDKSKGKWLNNFLKDRDYLSSWSRQKNNKKRKSRTEKRGNN